MIESTEQAIAELEDASRSELEREHAIQYLQEYRPPEGIDPLVTALDDDDYGVRWAAGSALATYGQEAMPALLKALTRPDSDSRLRECAVHIIHNNTSGKVKKDSQELLLALKGPSAGIATIEAAYELMETWDIR